MKTFWTYIPITAMFYVLTLRLEAQHRKAEWQVGYLSPFLTQNGVNVGFGIDVQANSSAESATKKSKSSFQLKGNLGFFSQVNVSQNILFNSELVYRREKPESRFFFTASVGAGYLRSIQRQFSTVNIGTGKLEHQNIVLNYFLPNLNLGIGVSLVKQFGLILNGCLGSTLSTKQSGAVFFCIEPGVRFRFKSNLEK